MRMRRRLGQAQHWSDARVSGGENVLPFSTRPAGECLGKSLPEHRPASAIMLIGQSRIGEVKSAQQCRIELRLQRANSHVLTICGGVGVIERRTAVKQIATALVLPGA